jgi:hypothetical protein
VCTPVRFLRVLRELAPDEENFYAEGAKEVEELMKMEEMTPAQQTILP